MLSGHPVPVRGHSLFMEVNVGWRFLHLSASTVEFKILPGHPVPARGHSLFREGDVGWRFLRLSVSAVEF